MALTKDFKDTVRRRVQSDAGFRKALLREAIECMLGGDVAAGKALLRNYINATLGFPKLQDGVQIPATSLMRMFSPKGNPSANNLFDVLAYLQQQEGINFELRPTRKAS